MRLKGPRNGKRSEAQAGRQDSQRPLTANPTSPSTAQLVRLLRQQITSGVLRPGDQLPSETQLCELYDVSPMTVRRAINVLLDEGTVDTEKGRGTFVRPLELGPAVFDLRELQKLLSSTSDTDVLLLETRVVAMDESIAYHLGVPEGDRVIHVRRLISSRGEPVMYHREYMVYDPQAANHRSRNGCYVAARTV